MPTRPSSAVNALRALAWPVRRFFGPQFAWVRAQVVETDHRLHGKIDQATAHIDERVDAIDARVREVLDGFAPVVTDATQTGAEALAQAGQELRSTSGWLANLQEQLGTLTADLGALRGDISELRLTGDWLASLQSELDRLTVGNEEFAALRDLIRQNPMRRAVGAPVGDMDAGLAELLNYAESHLGFRAQSDLWFNPPVQVAYVPGGVVTTGVNERIVEVPYVFRALAGVRPGGRVLDVGSAESFVSLSLASLGYDVTSLDLREYPLQHPGLEVVAAPLEEWDGPDEPYDAVVCLSSIEHFGIGAYGEEGGDAGADRAAIARLRDLTVDGGRLIFTAPYGRARVTDIERVYDRAGIEALLEGWEIEDLTVARNTGTTAWTPVADEDAPAGDEIGVVMVVARAAKE